VLSHLAEIMAQQSPWYLKYGPSTSDEFSGQSGYTPTAVVFPNSSGRTSQDVKKDEWQQKQLFGFTTRELMDLDAINEDALKLSNLRNGILPWLQIETVWANDSTESNPPELNDPYWDEADNMSDVDQREWWHPNNPKVKDILTPVLVLASRMMEKFMNGPLVRLNL